MKKLLITSTALVATAGFAAADGHISLGGFAEMGIASVDSNGSTIDGDPQLHQDLDISFKAEKETDGGLTFGAKMDLDEAGDLGAGVGDRSTNGEVYVKGGFGNLTMGDTDGALDWAMTEAGMGTSIADDHTEHAGYTGNSEVDSGNILRYDRTFGDFGVAVSYQPGTEATAGGVFSLNTATGAVAASAATPAGDAITQAGVKFSTDLGGTTVGFGLGYAASGDNNLTGVSADFGIAGVKAVVGYKTAEVGGADLEHTYIGLGYTIDALSFHANYGEKKTTVANVDTTGKGYGLNVNYDLGGGAIVALGYASDEVTGGAETTRYSLGIRMNF